ncbi:MAG: tRNA lysidine(34) synthetase TilS [Nibricoccus sp.]
MPEWEKFPALFSREDLHPAVIAHADKAAAENPGSAWCVAFSGGADSLALLLIVWALWPEKRRGLVALHFNHRLRGKESDGDAAFCGEVCGALGVDFRAGEWTDAKAGQSEAEARLARMAFFKMEMAAVGSTLLWTGHQKDDVAETLLMRIARGSGSSGLAAPRPVQFQQGARVFLRPLLTLAKSQIVSALTKAGAHWREDESNAAGDFFRNRMRMEVVPKWRAAAENDALNGAALSRDLLEEDDAALTAWLAELMPEAGYDGDTLDVRRLKGRPRALLRRALRKWRPLAELARTGFDAAVELVERGDGRISACEGSVEFNDGVLRYRPADSSNGAEGWPQAWLSEGTVLFLPDGNALVARAITFDEVLRTRIRAGSVDPWREAFLAEPRIAFCVRPARAGDRYRPLGAPGSAKLQDLFVNRKIPAERRAQLPVVVGEDGGILWVPGLPPAEKSKMTDDSVTGVHLTYETGTYTVRP